MRVIIFGNFVDHEVTLAESLSKSDRVLVLLPGRTVPERVAKLVHGGLDVRFMGRSRIQFHPANIVAYFEAWNQVRAFEPDVVHMEIFGGFADLAYLAMFNRCPIVTTFHDVDVHKGERSSSRNMVRRILRGRADRIIVHGRFLKKAMVERFSVPAAKVEVVPLGAPEFETFRMFQRNDIREDENLVLFFGRIVEYKGLEYLIKAEPAITKEFPDAKIVIAGGGLEFENFEKYRTMMAGREERFVVLNRFVSFEEGAELFQRSSVVVLPYVEASQSGVATVAYGFKKPVVATEVGSIPEIVHDGETGFLVPARDSQALAEAVLRLLRDKKLRREMGERGYIMLTTSLSLDAIAAKTREVYQNAISSRNDAAMPRRHH